MRITYSFLVFSLCLGRVFSLAGPPLAKDNDAVMIRRPQVSNHEFFFGLIDLCDTCNDVTAIVADAFNLRRIEHSIKGFLEMGCIFYKSAFTCKHLIDHYYTGI